MHPPPIQAGDPPRPRSRPAPAPARSADCAGVVLAGGLSTRMGRPKAALDVGGVPLLRRVVERLHEAFEEVRVVGADGQELPDVGVPLLRDGRPRTGPLGGLAAALAGCDAPAVFAVSCDVPCLQPALARRMVELARGWDAAVPRWSGRLHPLAGVYGRTLLPAARALLAEDRLRPVFLLDAGRSRIVEEGELRAADPAGLSFINVNTPDDLAALLAALPPRVTFELYGQPRVLAGRGEITLDVPTPATLGSALAALAREAPALVGPVLESDGTPLPSFLVGLDGRAFTRDAARTVADGERLLLLASAAGG